LPVIQENIYGKFERDSEYSYYISEGKENGFSRLKKVYTIKANMIYPARVYEEGIIANTANDTEKGIITGVYNINSNSGRCIYESSGMRMSLTCPINGYLYINNDTGEGSVLNKYNIEKNQTDEIMKYKSHIDKDDKITGDTVCEMYGFGNGLVVEIVKFNKEIANLDETGKAEIWYYDIDKEEFEKLPIAPKRKALYVGGDRDCIITSDYAFEEPLEDTGTIYLLKDNKYYEIKIPEIASANDIIEAHRLSPSVIAIMTSGAKLYLIDLKNYNYEVLDYEDICFGKDSFCMADKESKLCICSDFN